MTYGGALFQDHVCGATKSSATLRIIGLNTQLKRYKRSRPLGQLLVAPQLGRATTGRTYAVLMIVFSSATSSNLTWTLFSTEAQEIFPGVWDCRYVL